MPHKHTNAHYTTKHTCTSNHSHQSACAATASSSSPSRSRIVVGQVCALGDGALRCVSLTTALLSGVPCAICCIMNQYVLCWDALSSSTRDGTTCNKWSTVSTVPHVPRQVHSAVSLRSRFDCKIEGNASENSWVTVYN